MGGGGVRLEGEGCCTCWRKMALLTSVCLLHAMRPPRGLLLLLLTKTMMMMLLEAEAASAQHEQS